MAIARMLLLGLLVSFALAAGTEIVDSVPPARGPMIAPERDTSSLRAALTGGWRSKDEKSLHIFDPKTVKNPIYRSFVLVGENPPDKEYNPHPKPRFIVEKDDWKFSTVASKDTLTIRASHPAKGKTITKKFRMVFAADFYSAMVSQEISKDKWSEPVKWIWEYSPPVTEEVAPPPNYRPATASDIIVFVTPAGGKYHRQGCGAIRGESKGMTLEAARKNYAPCEICNPL